jgi:hypothetical protein
MFYDDSKLRTEITLNPGDYPKFGAASVWCGAGSCFSLNIAALLEQCGLEVKQNPSGIIYNSYSMLQVITRAAGAHYYSEGDFFEHAGLWHSWEHHGSFSRPDLKEALANANQVLKEFRETLEKAAAVVLTPSSSVVYCLKSSGDIVANCHKVNNNLFERKILTMAENRRYLTKAVKKILQFNANCKIIFTLSPVRHYPGDLALNSVSKANLRGALHEVCEEFRESCIYFPAYEILHDELRDYRFYKNDMLHPSEQAVELICGRFVKLFFTAEALSSMEKELAKAKFNSHRPIK